MSLYGDNIVYNPTARDSGLASWENKLAAVGAWGSDDAYSFTIRPGGYMKQSMPNDRFGRLTPLDFAAEIDYTLDTTPPGTKVVLYLEVEFVYADGAIDSYTFPLKPPVNTWNALREICETLEVKDSEEVLIPLKSMNVAVYNNSTSTVLRVDRIKLLPNKESREAAESDSNYENFSDKAILFGLEANMPILR